SSFPQDPVFQNGFSGYCRKQHRSSGSVPFDEVQRAGFTRNKYAEGSGGNSHKRLIFYSKWLSFVKCCFEPTAFLGEFVGGAG
ncbi:MAG: hypothetical protein PVH69_10460, partial [Desulfobacterales bacterium]